MMFGYNMLLFNVFVLDFCNIFVPYRTIVPVSVDSGSILLTRMRIVCIVYLLCGYCVGIVWVLCGYDRYDMIVPYVPID